VLNVTHQNLLVRFGLIERYCMKTKILAKVALAAALVAPVMVQAESNLISSTPQAGATTGTGSASARVNFSVVISRVLFLGVGTMSTSPRANNTAIDTVTFAYSNPANIGTGAAPDTTTNGTLAVALFGNNGQVTLSVTTGAVNLVGAIAGNTDVVPFTSIGVSSDAATLPAPTFGGAAVQPTLNAGRITNRTANWTYTYANTAALRPDSYTGQATYTAAMP
jgi:hypothetical protein